MMESDVSERELRNVRLLVAYDGTDFRGFAQSDGVRTIMGVLTEAVARITRVSAESLELVGSGRTDAGVHGWGQVVNGLIPADTDLYRLTASINALLRPEVSVREPEWVDPISPLDSRRRRVRIATTSGTTDPRTRCCPVTLGISGRRSMSMP